MQADKMEKSEESFDWREILCRREELLTWLMALLCLLWIPIRVVQYGYLPEDDGLRHVAHAVDGREWGDVLVLRPNVGLEGYPGWHALLQGLHRTLDWNQEALACFSVVALSSLVFLSGLLAVRRPTAWLLALLVTYLFSGPFIDRLMTGRPYLFTMSVMLLLLGLWRNEEAGPRRRARHAASIALVALAVWIHGNWYLTALLPTAMLLSGRFKSAIRLGVCWLCGSLLGALFTGHPAAFLLQHLEWVFRALGESILQRMLVGEFQPAFGADIIVPVALFFIWAMLGRNRSMKSLWADPVFMLALLGWLLGLRVGRFWYDWGRPAITLWFACQLADPLDEAGARPDGYLVRLGWTAFACVALVFSLTSDLSGRWTSMVMNEEIDARDPALAEWLPGPDGVVYSDRMSVFYRTYYANPHAPWKYVLGFEPGLMPDEDLRVYRYIQLHEHRAFAFAAWVEKMRPQDRMILFHPSQPGIPGLEWKRACRDTWIGRIPQPSNLTVPTTGN